LDLDLDPELSRYGSSSTTLSSGKGTKHSVPILEGGVSTTAEEEKGKKNTRR
jgi:hypothetical protein